MWRNIFGRATLRKIKSFSDSTFPGNRIRHIVSSIDLGGSVRNRLSTNPVNELARVPSVLRNQHWFATAAQTIDSTDPEDDSDEVNELMTAMEKETERVRKRARLLAKQPAKVVCGMGAQKYYSLKQRQVKLETEEWEKAAKECQEIIEDMCEQRLAPNLPYVKSLFLGWFEPLRDAIQADLDGFKVKKGKIPYASYMEQLPADMMAVITMHKMMGLLMTNAEGVGVVKVVNAATQIGEAIEQEARINSFMKKAKKKKNAATQEDDEAEGVDGSG
ncbi:DNA-directed RNA polymerase 1, mitochondrial-like, partial [Raphanus sativus]|uniref:DNA-directed RNA polymerase 1, mitochondrial-like n=1 Tax=Raphanus sativus TaxID=3726 RepID=A0A9W3CZY8_RAPSA